MYKVTLLLTGAYRFFNSLEEAKIFAFEYERACPSIRGVYK